MYQLFASGLTLTNAFGFNLGTTSASRAPSRNLVRVRSPVELAGMSPPLAARTSLFDSPVSCTSCADCTNELVAPESNNASAVDVFLLRTFHRSIRRAHFTVVLDGSNAVMQQSTPTGTWSWGSIFGGGGESPVVTR